MERLLTPIVSKLLSRFVKSAAGKDGSDLRASLSGGKVVLYNLELDLMSLFEGLPVAVDRAFAKRLTVSIPWTSLGSQPIQVYRTCLSLTCIANGRSMCRNDRGCIATNSVHSEASSSVEV